MGYVFDAIARNGPDDPKNPGKSPVFEAGTLPPSPPADDSVGDALIAEFDDAPAPIELRYHPEPESDVAPAVAPRAASDAAILAEPSQYDDRLVAVTNPSSLMTEEYRSIRTSLLARWQNRSHLVHTITSATPQEGKTITSVNLGLTFAELRACKTVIVEADLRLPTFDKLLGRQSNVGLIQHLRGEATLDQIVQPLDGHPLHVIPAGGRTCGDAVQLLSGPRLQLLLAQLRKRYDHVIIDTPPVVELADAGIVGKHSDEVLLVVRMNRTPRTLVEQAIRTLQSYNAPVAGAIATDQARSRHKYYYYRYGYRYGYGYGYTSRKAA